MSMHHSYESAGITPEELKKQFERLLPEINHVRNALAQGYDTPYACINVPTDAAMHQQVQAMINEKKALKPTTLVVIGIGGSNLGTKAVLTALRGMFYNEQMPDIKCYFADTVDTDYIYDIVLFVEQEWEKGNEVIINVISKSGTTTETIANFELFFYLLEKARAHYQPYVVVTTDEGSVLWQFAQEKKLSCLAIPKQVGGRYSLFSAVGQFPLGLCGINVQELLRGAADMVKSGTEQLLESNVAAVRAIVLWHAYQCGMNIHDMFLFSVDLQDIGFWYRQLMGESIGKRYDAAGNEVWIGITPTVSIGTTDLHSVAQLYLGGPHDKFTTFVTVKKTKSNLVLPKRQEFDQLVPHMQGLSYNELRAAIVAGTQKAYAEENRLFDLIELPEKSAYAIGKLLQLYMLEMIYLGYLLAINPFDQPQVELYKRQTRRLLAQ